MRAFGLVAGLLSLTALGSAEELSVCDVLQKLFELPNGGTISVRGELIATDESLVMGGGSCKAPFVTDSYVWPDHIALSQTGARGHRFPDSFTSEESSTKDLIHFIRQMQAAGPKLKVYVTATGRFERRDKYFVRRYSKDSVFANGFGHLGASAAIVVYRSFSSWEVKRDGENNRDRGGR